MEEKTRIVWEFFELFYRKGLLDEVLRIYGNTLNPDMDLLEGMQSMEDKVGDMNFSEFDDTITQLLLPTLKALTDEDRMEELKTIIKTFGPIIEQIIQKADGDIDVVIEKISTIGKIIVSMKPLMMAVIPAVTPALIDNVLAKNPSRKTRFFLGRVKKRLSKKQGGILAWL